MNIPDLSYPIERLLGDSSGMQSLSKLIDRVSKVTANVLIVGESGTGKEMVARHLHHRGSRADRPFVAINCAAIPEGLLESELFGHAKGSFTGASQRKSGLFEEADGGTLFLDEIGDMNPSLQTKILRVIQEREIRAVGENCARPVDVRIIAATHRDLHHEMKKGRFREDLYYRLSVVPIRIPPLRSRKGDIPALANHFLKKYAAIHQSPVRAFSRQAIETMTNMRWEGNVRELENFVERAVVLGTESILRSEDLPAGDDTVDPEQFFRCASDDFPTLAVLQKRYLALVLKKTRGRRDQAAKILGINRRTLYRKVNQFGPPVAESAE